VEDLRIYKSKQREILIEQLQMLIETYYEELVDSDEYAKFK